MKKRLPFDLEEKIKKTFQIKCLQNDDSMTHLLTKFVQAYNKNPEKVKKFIEK